MMQNVDYMRIAAVIAGFQFSAMRQEVMQAMADMFHEHEPRFDYLVFARASKCRYVCVKSQYVRIGDVLFGLGTVCATELEGDLWVFTVEEQPWRRIEFLAGEMVELFTGTDHVRFLA